MKTSLLWIIAAIIAVWYFFFRTASSAIQATSGVSPVGAIGGGTGSPSLGSNIPPSTITKVVSTPGNAGVGSPVHTIPISNTLGPIRFASLPSTLTPYSSPSAISSAVPSNTGNPVFNSPHYRGY